MSPQDVRKVDVRLNGGADVKVEFGERNFGLPTVRICLEESFLHLALVLKNRFELFLLLNISVISLGLLFDFGNKEFKKFKA